MDEAARLKSTQHALLFGNFAIGCGVMVAAGTLNDLVRALQVSVAVGGQLIAVAAATMCIGAPLLAAAVGRFDRRRLLAFALLWYGVGHALSAAMPDYALLMPVRAATVLGAALFTPQAAAAIGAMAPPAQRGRAITSIFVGWSLASVLGMPIGSVIGETFGWRSAFAAIAALSLFGAAWVWRAMPDGVRPPALSRASWGQVFTSPVLVAMIGVTALSSAGQFTLFSYFAPYARQVLDADAASLGLLFFAFGAFGLAGNLWVARAIDRLGPARCVLLTLGGMALSLLLWPLAGSVAALIAVCVPWGFGCFASNSAQQARLGQAAPALAAALMALNTSAMYLGQAAGSSSGGAMVGAAGFAPLHWVGLAWMVAAIALSQWVARRSGAPGHA